MILFETTRSYIYTSLHMLQLYCLTVDYVSKMRVMDGKLVFSINKVRSI